MNAISRKELETLAELAQLEFSEEEYKKLEANYEIYKPMFDEIRNAKVDISSIHANPVVLGDLRDDVVIPSLPIEKALNDAPQKRGRYFVVSKVVE